MVLEMPGAGQKGRVDFQGQPHVQGHGQGEEFLRQTEQGVGLIAAQGLGGSEQGAQLPLGQVLDGGPVGGIGGGPLLKVRHKAVTVKAGRRRFVGQAAVLLDAAHQRLYEIQRHANHLPV
jgi:hypothetical protein